MGGNCYTISIYHTKLLLGTESENNASISRVSRISTTATKNEHISSQSDFCKELKNKIDNKKPAVIYVTSSRGQHYVTAVGYKNDGSSFDEFLLLGSYSGNLLKGTTGEAKKLRVHNGIGYRSLLFI